MGRAGPAGIFCPGVSSDTPTEKGRPHFFFPLLVFYLGSPEQRRLPALLFQGLRGPLGSAPASAVPPRRGSTEHPPPQ